MGSYLGTINKLQTALNRRGYQILINRTQFYSQQQKRAITIYKVSQSQFDAELGKAKNTEIFSSASQIQVMLFMRNLWFLIQDKEIPHTYRMKGGEVFAQKWEKFESDWRKTHPQTIEK